MQPTETWQESLQRLLPLYGHRNWIVIADSAYPAQISPGVRTVAGHDDHLAVLRRVLHEIDGARHVRPVITIDSELALMDEADAPGADAFRTQLNTILDGHPVTAKPHDDTIARLDAAGQTFSALVIKTTMAMPYTTVFIELDCGYWDVDAEKRLRAKVEG
ncbi:MAG TPA: hypothetical protein VGK19_06665 [Capsulimonadaceae bacterium]|jgi:hypothetical protein